MKSPELSLTSARIPWYRWAAIGISLGILGMIVWRLNPTQLGHALAQLRMGWAAAALGCVIGASMVLGVRWKWMLELQEADHGWPAAWAGVLISNALGAALLGAILGDLGKSAWYARRYREPLPTLFLACGLDRLCGGVGMIFYGLIAAAFAMHAGHAVWHHAELHPQALGRGLVATVVILFVVGWGARHFRNRWRSQWEEWRTRIHEAAGLFRTRPGKMLAAAGLSLLAHVLVGATLACGLAAANAGPVPWLELVWSFPLISLAAALPLTFAGAGAREGAAIAIWGWYGIAAPTAVAACWVTLVATLLGALPGALLFLQSERKTTTPTAH